MHAQFSAGVRILGRTWDLEAAYNQFAVLPAHRFASIIAVEEPGKRDRTFWIGDAPPFGARASVHSFNRPALALRRLALTQLGAVATNYFDDYPHIEFAELANSAAADFRELTEIFGFAVSNKPEKNLEHAASFCPLGAVVDFSDLANGVIEVRNKPGRAEEVQALALSDLDQGTLSPAQAASLRGHLLYLEQQCVGSCGAMATRALGRRAQQAGGSYGVEGDIGRALKWIADYIVTAVPRAIRLRKTEPPVMVFTDGAWEALTATIGAIIFVPGERSLVFGEVVPESIRQSWAGDADLQVIGQAELLPIFAAKQKWAAALSRRRAIYFVEKGSARHACIRLYSPIEASSNIFWAIAEQDLQAQASSWYARVPSASNPADDPSRLRCEEACGKWNAVHVQLTPLQRKTFLGEGHGRAATRDKPSLTRDGVLSTRAVQPRARAQACAPCTQS